MPAIRILRLTVTPWNRIDPGENGCGRPGAGYFPGMPEDYLHAADRHTWTSGIQTPPDYLIYTTAAAEGGQVVAAAQVTGWTAKTVKGHQVHCFGGAAPAASHPVHQLFVGQPAPRELFRNPARPFWLELTPGGTPRIRGDHGE